MHWLRRILAPHNRPFIIFTLVLAAFLIAGGYYQGVINRRTMTRAVSAVRRAFADKRELPALKMERSTLEFQLPNLPRQFPILTNAALARAWSAAAVSSQLDPDVRETWNAYLNRVSPLVLQTDPAPVINTRLA